MLKLLVLLGSFAWSPTADSLRLETINGKQFIIHQVEARETLFGISRRYGVVMASVIEANPDADGGIEVGQILRIPYSGKKRVTDASSTHEVGPKETLFGISRMYNVTVDDLKAWNNLTSNDLNLGQTLIVRKPLTPTPQDKPAPVAISHTVKEKETLYGIARQYGVKVQDLRAWNNLDESAGLKPGQTLVVSKPDGTQPVTETATTKNPAPATITISERALGSAEVRENGNAAVMEGTEGNRKYLALHRTIKTGAIVKVRNPLSNKEVFVRITGPLPATDTTDTLIRISKSAYDQIGSGPSTVVEVIYYP